MYAYCLRDVPSPFLLLHLPSMCSLGIQTAMPAAPRGSQENPSLNTNTKPAHNCRQHPGYGDPAEYTALLKEQKSALKYRLI